MQAKMHSSQVDCLPSFDIAPPPAEKPLETSQLIQDTQAIHNAITREDNWFSATRSVDIQAVHRILQNKTDAERDEVDKIYKESHSGTDMYTHLRSNGVSGSDLEHFYNIRYRKDNDIVSQSEGHR